MEGVSKWPKIADLIMAEQDLNPGVRLVVDWTRVGGWKDGAGGKLVKMLLWCPGWPIGRAL